MTLRQSLTLILISLTISGPSLAQQGNVVRILFPGAPTGSCSPFMEAVNTATGDFYDCLAGSWHQITGGGGGIPSGSILLVDSGDCPAGFTDVNVLNGQFLQGTLAANGDVGGTGGASTITPAGTNSTVAFTPTGSVAAPTFTGSSGTVPAQTFTGASDTTSSVSAGTPAGSNTSGAFTEGAISWPAGVPTNASGAFTEGAIAWPAGVPTFAGSAGTVPAETFTGTPFTSVINHTHTVTVTYDAQGGTTAATTGTHSMTSTATGGSVRALTSGDVVSATTANPSGGVSSITPAGTNATASFTPAGTVAWPAGVPTIAAGTFTQPTISWPAGVPTIAAGSFTQPTFTGSALAGHTHTVTPTGTNGTVAFTPAGTNSAPAFTGNSGTIPAETFAGNAFDPRPLYTKVIFCQKT